jgi:hypothetical protein
LGWWWCLRRGFLGQWRITLETGGEDCKLRKIDLLKGSSMTRLRIVRILSFRMQIEIVKTFQDFKIKIKDCQKKEQQIRLCSSIA